MQNSLNDSQLDIIAFYTVYDQACSSEAEASVCSQVSLWKKLHCSDQAYNKELLCPLAFNGDYIQLRYDLQASLRSIKRKKNTVLLFSDPCLILGSIKQTCDFLTRVASTYNAVYLLPVSYRTPVTRYYSDKFLPDRASDDKCRKIPREIYEEMLVFLSTKKEDEKYPSQREACLKFHVKSPGSLAHYVKKRYHQSVRDYLRSLADYNN